MNKALKVIFVTSTFSFKKNDSLVPWMRRLVVELRSGGVDIKVLAPAVKGSPSHEVSKIPVYRFRYAPASLEILTQDEGAITKIHNNPFLALLAVPYIFFGTIAGIRRSIGAHYDVVHVNWPFPLGIIGLIIKWVSGAKLVLTFYGAEFVLVNKFPFGKLILAFIIKRADKVIAISSHTKAMVQQIADVDVSVIPFTSGIQITAPKSINRKQSRTKRILFVGRLIERKGVKYLVDAIPDVLGSMKVEVDIVGGGPLITELKKQTNRKGLNNAVTIHGKVSKDKLKKLYLMSDVFVLPAIIDQWGDTEGLGVVLLEAMSISKPVIASKVGGITDIVKHNKTGYLVPEKNSPALSKALVKILSDQKLANRLAKSGQQFVQEKFDWNVIIKRTLKIYQ